MTWIKVILAITWVLISLATNYPQIQAQNTGNGGSSDPSGGGRDPNRTSGSDRGNCPVVKNENEQESLTALVAQKGEALTTSDSPTLLFYVPYASTTPLEARFSLRDDKGYNVIKPILMTLSGTPGVVRVRLPKSLEKEKLYRWSFAIICEPTDESKNPGVDGWLRRVDPSPSLASQLTGKVSQRELAALYTKEGILLDALTLLAEIRYTDPQAESDWTSLLQSLGLEVIATEQVIQCCTPKQ
ncbi:MULTISPECIES: DUF928 domain-containing protein [Cyanophyceae]|uniref:DUF928 domain-containing protein n=1 Tax=Cyanophyceae TaxID=3028117 RepID=UPI001683B264|nr:DUF928 domain-containing protein [Trichocoleus sp. FACHB-40]MBD2002741.1 DUF928 domain-containing protein [Trichocoleus sp. FACHB-40]